MSFSTYLVSVKNKTIDSIIFFGERALQRGFPLLITHVK